jgi:2-hydroxychromene-2-carboxylate isomerase
MRAFRAAFQEGRDLSIPERVLDVAADVGLDREAAAAAASDPTVKATLRAATDAAHARGVFGVPTLAIDDELFWGEDRLADAAAHLGRSSVR